MNTITHSEEETKEYGRNFARLLKAEDVVILAGPLGAGKTVFIKGAVSQLCGPRVRVRSPSFTLVRQYSARNITVFHIDLYRIQKMRELFELGYEDYFYSPRGISFIEWGERVESALSRYIKVTISLKTAGSRKITVTQKGYPRTRFLKAQVSDTERKA